MPRSTWDMLPAAVRAATERQTGPVLDVALAETGRNSDFAATLRTAAGLVFCKGIETIDGEDVAGGRRGRAHRHEAEINPWLPPAIAPRLRWRFEVQGWLLLGFDHVPGRHADFAPGSADLPLVADSVTALGRELAGCGADAARLSQQWARFVPWRRLAHDVPDNLDSWVGEHLHQLVDWERQAVELAEGDTLLHTDLHPWNVLVSDRARVVDWAWSRIGSPAVDVAFLIARLVAAGHDPTAAEAFAESIPAWRSTSPDGRTALAVMVWGLWREQTELAAVAQWARHRLGDPPQ
jgi:hypothetical protein